MFLCFWSEISVTNRWTGGQLVVRGPHVALRPPHSGPLQDNWLIYYLCLSIQTQLQKPWTVNHIVTSVPPDNKSLCLSRHLWSNVVFLRHQIYFLKDKLYIYIYIYVCECVCCVWVFVCVCECVCCVQAYRLSVVQLEHLTRGLLEQTCLPESKRLHLLRANMFLSLLCRSFLPQLWKVTNKEQMKIKSCFVAAHLNPETSGRSKFSRSETISLISVSTTILY